MLATTQIKIIDFAYRFKIKIDTILLVLALFCLASCSDKKYTSADGEKIFASSSMLIVDQNLLSISVEPLAIIEDTCMLTTDFDYQNAFLSMESYPKINVSQYKKYFSRDGNFDFYLHPIICGSHVYDIDKNARLTAYELDNGNVKKIWSENLLERKENRNFLMANARLEDDMLYVSTNDGYVIAFDVVQRKIMWKKYIGGSFAASPTIYENNLYLSSITNEILAINKKDGEVVWRVQETNDNKISSLQIAPIAIYHGKVVAGLSNGNVVVLNADDGKIVWKNSIVAQNFGGDKSNFNDIDFTPILFEDILVAGGIRSGIVGFDFKTGAPMWQLRTGLNSYMFYNKQGFGFFVNDNNENVCFYIRTGAVRWIRDNNSTENKTKVPVYLNNGKDIAVTRVNRFYDAY